MTIVSTDDIINGQPRLDQHRLSVAHVITNVDEKGLEEYLEDYNLKQEINIVRSAIEYCMNQRCDDNVVNYCTGCNKNPQYPGEDLWKKAKRLYFYNFVKP